MQINRSHTPRLGYVYVVLATLLWATSGSAAKFLFLGGVSPFELVQLRSTISAGLLFLWLLAAKRSLLKIKRKDLAYFFFLGIVLGATQFTYLYAISRINVAAAVLLQYQAPVLIVIHALLFKRRRPSHVTLAALLGAVTGCYLMEGGYNLDILNMNSLGILSGLACAVAFALYSVKSEYGMRSYTPWTVLFYALLFAAVIWNVLKPPLSAFSSTYSAVSWWWILFVAVFGTVIPYGLYNEGINLIQPTHASITATLEPVLAGGISFLFLGEIMEPLQIAGAGLVIASVLILQVRKDPA